MKTRFTTVDIKAVVFELNVKLLGLRVINVYDVDNKTYLIKLAKPDAKEVLLMESGCRFHTTDFEWPKNTMPSGFAMKMRKHLKSRRLEKIEQLGEDRIVDFQFGSGEAAYHIILELYDRGNIVLTDYEYTILNILRPRTDDSQDVRFAVREKYPLECAKKPEGMISAERLLSVLASAKDGDNLRKTLLPHLVYGPAVIDHCLLANGFSLNAKIGKDIDPAHAADVDRLMSALQLADNIMLDVASHGSKGYIIQQREKKAAIQPGDISSELLTYSEFHPVLFTQHESGPLYVEFDSFNKSVDEFFSKIESQKLDVKLLQQEKAALKKLENVKKDHLKRLEELEQEQSTDIQKAQLIEINLSLVDRAIAVVRSLLASQLDWLEIEKLVREAATQGDTVAASIKSLKLQTNHVTMLLHPKLSVPSLPSDDSEDEEVETLRPTKVDIDLGLSAYANARKYFDMKRHAAQKQQKTINASQKALKSAERKTKQTLKEVQTTATINKARKTYWFEKFLWCISSENYLLIGGRDQQQNEMIVKRYLRPGDLYVHADLHGASSIVIKNPSKDPVPPKTLNEAGTMALCYSAAWDARVITSAWWVYHDQVSKTAPTGEYLTTGSFMIRGKKNYLSPSYLVYGFGFLFKLDESCLAQHKNERRVRTLEEENAAVVTSISGVAELSYAGNAEQALMTEELDEGNEISDGNDDDDDSENEGIHSDDNEKDNEGGIVTDSSSDDDRADKENVEETILDRSPHDEIPIGGCNVAVHGSGLTEVLPDIGAVKAEPDAKFCKNLPVAADSGGDSGEDFLTGFPDTNIALQYVGGDKFALQTNVSTRVHSSDIDDEKDNVIYLGDDKPLKLGGGKLETEKQATTSGRLSAKQRRELKKSHQKVQFESSPADGATKDDNDSFVNSSDATNRHQSSKPVAKSVVVASDKLQQAQPKRGQKSKLKKIQEKYADQDEEERRLRLEILASAGAPKEDSKTKKGKKGKDTKSSASKRQQPQQSSKQKPPSAAVGKVRPPGRLTVDDIVQEMPVAVGKEVSEMTVVPPSVDLSAASDAVNVDVDDDDETAPSSTQDADILDSLTGIPTPEDILLFCIPVCAPYSALSNYRYKVKLVPGTTKRGKAVKMSLEMFVRDRTATPREKDLFRSVKDADLSRNMPGKVKVSAPNLHKQKHKS